MCDRVWSTPNSALITMVMHTTQCVSSNGYWEEFWYDIRLTHILNSQNINLWAPEVLQHEKYFSLIQEKNTDMLVRHLCRSLYSLKWREHLVVEIFPHLSKYFKHPIHDSISIFLVKAHHYESVTYRYIIAPARDSNRSHGIHSPLRGPNFRYAYLLPVTLLFRSFPLSFTCPIMSLFPSFPLSRASIVHSPLYLVS